MVDENSVGFLQNGDQELFEQAKRLLSDWAGRKHFNNNYAVVYVTTSASEWTLENLGGEPMPEGVVGATIETPASDGKYAIVLLWDRIHTDPDPLARLLISMASEIAVGVQGEDRLATTWRSQLARLRAAVEFLRVAPSLDGYELLPLSERSALEHYLSVVKDDLRAFRIEVIADRAKDCDDLLSSLDN